MENGFSGKLKRLGMPDTFVEHGSRDQILTMLGLDENGVANTIQEMVSKKEKPVTP